MLKSGIGELIETLEDRLKANNVNIHLNTKITNIEYNSLGS